MTTYHVTKRFKDSYESETVEEGLTRREAVTMIEEDVQNNPNAEEYMLTFDED